MILDTIEIWVCKFLVKRFKRYYSQPVGYGRADSEECRAGKAIAFLKENIAILEL